MYGTGTCGIEIYRCHLERSRSTFLWRCSWVKPHDITWSCMIFMQFASSNFPPLLILLVCFSFQTDAQNEEVQYDPAWSYYAKGWLWWYGGKGFFPQFCCLFVASVLPIYFPWRAAWDAKHLKTCELGMYFKLYTLRLLWCEFEDAWSGLRMVCGLLIHFSASWGTLW